MFSSGLCAAPGQQAKSLAKSLSQFLATLPSSSALPAVPSAGTLPGTVSGHGLSSGMGLRWLLGLLHRLRGVSILSLEPPG